MSLIVDPSILASLRELLQDTDSTHFTWTDSRLTEALRVHRETIRVRDPFLFTAGVYARHRYFAPVPVPWSDIPETLLQPEPGGASFQAAPFRRYWDPSQGENVEVWVLGVKQQYGLDYQVDWMNGRVTFQNSPNIQLPVDDWKPVQAGYSYYRMRHAMRDVIAGSLATNPVLQVKFGANEAVQQMPASEILKALQVLIAEETPDFIAFQRKTY